MPTPIRLHNTLTRRVEELTPLKPGEVTLYTCGPTVYNYYHIGNLRNAVFNDTLRRTLEAADYRVKHVMNVTDVGHLTGDNEGDADEGEDKLEKGAAREGKTVWDVAEHYTEAFKRDMAALNVSPPTVSPHRSKNTDDHDAYARATDFIPEQIELVKRLLEKGFAYQTQQAIYFDVTKLEDYGKLTGQKLADKETGARSDVHTDPHKRSPHDFAVWFFTVGRFADHTMHWPSPWGDGFPGWHLECSAIIHATLGDPIDIHTGGVDHIGTHHPNEMAQTEAAFGHDLANVWVHNEFMLVDGAKMAKSKGNSYTLKDITEHQYDLGVMPNPEFSAMALRLLYLQAHYRSELDFSWYNLLSTRQRLHDLYNWASYYHTLPNYPELPMPELATQLEEAYADFLAAMFNDLDTPKALAILSDLVSRMDAQQTLGAEREFFKHAVKKFEALLGIGMTTEVFKPLSKGEETLIKKREAARSLKDWVEADRIRDLLRAQGLELDDRSWGTGWRRTIV